jgi:hypothetical protein
MACHDYSYFHFSYEYYGHCREMTKRCIPLNTYGSCVHGRSYFERCLMENNNRNDLGNVGT